MSGCVGDAGAAVRGELHGVLVTGSECVDNERPGQPGSHMGSYLTSAPYMILLHPQLQIIEKYCYKSG